MEGGDGTDRQEGGEKEEEEEQILREIEPQGPPKRAVYARTSGPWREEGGGLYAHQNPFQLPFLMPGSNSQCISQLHWPPP